jgi:IclR family KDG regulon transcriptional repressor
LNTPLQLPPNRYRIEAVDKAMMLLDTLALLPGATPSQLAHALSANRSLVFRMLQTLLDRGFVAKDSSNGYRLGPRLLYLGQQAEKGTALIDASRDILDQLLEETRENVYLIVREGMDMLCLAVRMSPHPVRLSAEVGTKGGLHTGGAAKMLLAHSPPDVIEAVIDRHLDEFVPASLRTREQILEVLDKIRRDDFYEAIGELNPETYTLTAAVRDGTGAVGAVLSIAGPSVRLDAESQPRLLQCVREAAARISARLGQ